MKPTLFVLAAGMGSRYGGLKQLDGLGPNGETIMDYSIYDAIRGGFGKVVFVIRKDFEQDFREKILSKYENHIPVELVFQALDNLPEGFTCPADRVKPWGTNHAVLMGKDVIKEPFAVINADDFYGRDSFAVLGAELSQMDGKKNDYCMVGYRVGNTLSESGSVARGVCETNAEGYLTTVVVVLKRLACRRDDAGRACKKRGRQIGEGLARARPRLGDENGLLLDRAGRLDGELALPLAHAEALDGLRERALFIKGECNSLDKRRRGVPETRIYFSSNHLFPSTQKYFLRPESLFSLDSS